MRRILHKEYFRGLLNVKIEGLMMKNKIGDIVTDDKGNKFVITSVPMISGIDSDRKNTELIVEPTDSSSILGDALDID